MLTKAKDNREKERQNEDKRILPRNNNNNNKAQRKFKTKNKVTKNFIYGINYGYS